MCTLVAAAAALQVAPRFNPAVAALQVAPNTIHTPSCRAPAPTLKIEDLDEANFAEEIEKDGLAIVEFYAPWCRTCRGVAPTLERMANKMQNEGGQYDSVRFYKVNFKENKKLSLRERVFALPAVHMYSPGLGRINRFTLTPATVAKKIRTEVDRYVGDSGHLALLKTLQNKPNPLDPLVRFNLLAGFLQALANVDKYLESASDADGEYLAGMMEGDARRIEQLEELFAWMDANDDGYIDADELAAVALAVGTDGGLGTADSSVDVGEFYTTLLDHAQASVMALGEDPAAADASDEGEVQTCGIEPCALDFASFVRLMTSKAVTEWKTPEKELQPAFTALDTNNDGVITKEEMLKAMECVGNNLSPPGDQSWAQEAGLAFDAIDVDKSGSLDYEEFVAVMSGMRSSPYSD